MSHNATDPEATPQSDDQSKASPPPVPEEKPGIDLIAEDLKKLTRDVAYTVGGGAKRGASCAKKVAKDAAPGIIVFLKDVLYTAAFCLAFLVKFLYTVIRGVLEGENLIAKGVRDGASAANTAHARCQESLEKRLEKDAPAVAAAEVEATS